MNRQRLKNKYKENKITIDNNIIGNLFYFLMQSNDIWIIRKESNQFKLYLFLEKGNILKIHNKGIDFHVGPQMHYQYQGIYYRTKNEAIDAIMELLEKSRTING